MDRYILPKTGAQFSLFTVSMLDIILCMFILVLLGVSLHPYYQVDIYVNEYVEQVSLISSAIGFVLVAVLLLTINYFGSSFRSSVIFLKICGRNGIFHLICALALIFYYATSWGMLQIIIGHIYRDYGYIQLVNALFYFALFGYFIRSLHPRTAKG